MGKHNIDATKHMEASATVTVPRLLSQTLGALKLYQTGTTMILQRQFKTLCSL